MRIRLIRDDLGVAASAPDSDQMTEQGGRRFWLRGAVIDVPERAAVLLVGNGDAEPADDEAERVCKGWQNNRQQQPKKLPALLQKFSQKPRVSTKRWNREHLR